MVTGGGCWGQRWRSQILFYAHGRQGPEAPGNRAGAGEVVRGASRRDAEHVWACWRGGESVCGRQRHLPAEERFDICFGRSVKLP